MNDEKSYDLAVAGIRDDNLFPSHLLDALGDTVMGLDAESTSLEMLKATRCQGFRLLLSEIVVNYFNCINIMLGGEGDEKIVAMASAYSNLLKVVRATTDQKKFVEAIRNACRSDVEG